MKIIFFGSTSDSVIVLGKLSEVVAVVTQPPRPIGRDKVITPTPVDAWAKAHQLPILSFATNPDKPWEYADEQAVVDTLQPFKADLFVSASYGQKIPSALINAAKYGGLNVHPSVLPRWRGTDPVPWTLLSGDHQTGVTIVTLSTTKFDVGRIIAQKKIPVTPHDTTVPLREKLFELGAELLCESLPDYVSGKNKGAAQKTENEPYAKRLTRDDGFEKWENIIDPAQSEKINRKFRSFYPWPGLWTLVDGKRLKILKFTHEPVTVQLEGKTPVSWEQFKSAYLPS